MGGHSRPQSDRERRKELAEALEATGGDKSKAARLLGIHRRTVYRRLKRLGGTEELE
ncbi:MAG: helix-turn-helix domain-containing protein [Gemmatimonadota bacterium]|nr:helix-turn-helix domain-containing protein [Gemmatimonadota bacterium]